MKSKAHIIDALLYERLFGVHVTEREVVVDTNGALWDKGAFFCGNSRTVKRWVTEGGPGDYVEVDPLSTTWSGLGRIVDAMKKRMYAFQLWSVSEDAWDAEFFNSEGNSGCASDFDELPDSGPMAGALAACSALRLELPN
jgi:hypothetical protein